METLLFLIRHGETEWNHCGRIQGHCDLKLTPAGEQQADCLAARFVGKNLAAVYASDLQRAAETARRLARAVGLTVCTLPALRERSFGDLEGRTVEEIRARFHDFQSSEAKYGMEPFASLQKRAVDCLTAIAQRHLSESVAVVSHGGLLNAFLHSITNGTLGTGVTRLDNTGVTSVTYRAGQWKVIDVNDTRHLQQPPMSAG